MLQRLKVGRTSFISGSGPGRSRSSLFRSHISRVIRERAYSSRTDGPQHSSPYDSLVVLHFQCWTEATTPSYH